jgi:hypothetical protein
MPGEHSGNQSGFDSTVKPEADLLSWFRSQRRLTGADAAIYKMLQVKESNGMLDNYVLTNHTPQSARMVESMDTLKSMYSNSSKLQITETSPGIYKVADQARDTVVEYYYIPPVRPQQSTVSTTPPVKKPTKKAKQEPKKDPAGAKIPIKTDDLKPSPIKLWYSNDYKALIDKTLDSLALDIVTNTKDLLTNFTYSSIDVDVEEYSADTINYPIDNPQQANEVEQEGSDPISEVSVDPDIYDPAIIAKNNENIEKYYTTSLNILNTIFEQLASGRDISRFAEYFNLFDGPYYDEKDGSPYYVLSLNINESDSSISYIIDSKELTKI